jgi:hypothetical protein
MFKTPVFHDLPMGGGDSPLSGMRNACRYGFGARTRHA